MPAYTAPTARFPSGLRIAALDAGDVVVRVHQKIHGAIFFGPAPGTTPQAGSMRLRASIAFCTSRNASKGHLLRPFFVGLQTASFGERSWKSACGRHFDCIAN